MKIYQLNKLNLFIFFFNLLIKKLKILFLIFLKLKYFINNFNNL